MQEKKLRVKNSVLYNLKLSEKKFVLIKDNEKKSRLYKSIWTYIKGFLEHLWNEPYIVYQIIINAKINDVKNCFAPFFVNNFYQNFLSSNYVDDNLLYIISLLIKQEIEPIEANYAYIFLHNTPAGYVLQQLCHKKDIKLYCKTIIQSVVENLETKPKKLFIDIDELKTIYNKKYNKDNKKETDANDPSKKSNPKDNDKKDSTKLNLDLEKLMEKKKKVKEKAEIFVQKYMSDLTLNILNDMLKNYKKEKNIIMEEYINYQIENIKLNGGREKLYNNDKFLISLYSSPYHQIILSKYLISFFKITESIDQLFANLAEKTHIIPFSLKCICKIILTLLQNKFKNITKIQKISFISRFFFDTILLPIFENPTLGAFINEYIISGKTFESLKIISGVISQFCLGKFYIQDIKKGYYTPFNLYFIEKIPKLYQFFDSLTDVTLPPFIDKLINDKLPNNYKFSIFKDNPYENYYYRSMVFSFDEIYILINTIINCKSKLTFDEKSKPLEIVINKLTNEYSMTTINEIRDSEKKKEEEYEKIKSPDKKLAKKKYVIHSELLYNDKMSYLMKINQEKPNFNLEQLKNVENNNDNQKDNLIKVKNLIYSILYNIDNLKTSHFKQKDLTNLLNILNCLKKYIESLNIVIDGNVPLEWYATSLLEYIKLIPENMKKNDYELLFADMENDLKKSIDSLDFNFLADFVNKSKYAKINKQFYFNEENILLELILNKKVTDLIEKMIIPYELTYSLKEPKKYICIKEITNETYQMNVLETILFKESKPQTIESFSHKFPNISKKLDMNDDRLFNEIKDLNIADSIIL